MIKINLLLYLAFFKIFKFKGNYDIVQNGVMQIDQFALKKNINH